MRRSHIAWKTICLLSVILAMNTNCESDTNTNSKIVKRAADADKIIGNLFDGYQIIQSKILRLRNIICNSSVGRIPGKLTDENKAYFSYNKREYVCHNYAVLEGKRIPNTGEIPEECKDKGYLTIDDQTVYPAVVYNKHGEIPGKAYDGSYGYYGYDRGQYRRRNFDWFC